MRIYITFTAPWTVHAKVSRHRIAYEPCALLPKGSRFEKLDEIVLWFDAYMFDQTILIHLIDQWLGDVHLHDAATVWRWDKPSEQLVRRD